MVGVVLMAAGQALYSANNQKYWDYAAYGPLDQWVIEGQKLDQYMAVFNIGLIVVGFGLAVLAFSLARQRPSVQFREIPSHIPLEQYPQAPQQPQSPP